MPRTSKQNAKWENAITRGCGKCRNHTGECWTWSLRGPQEATQFSGLEPGLWGPMDLVQNPAQAWCPQGDVPMRIQRK